MVDKKPENALSWVMHWLGSLQLAVMLLLTLAAVLAVGTILESVQGRPFAQWYVYQSAWFKMVLVLLGVNILLAAVNRFPWKRHQIGFVVTHGGLLILLAGAMRSLLGGVDGSVTLAEGESAARFANPQQSQITASWLDKPGEAPYYFSFVPGPSDWREGTQLDLGEVDGIGARVLHYYDRAGAREEWIPDATGIGGPVVKFKVDGPHNSNSVAEPLLVDQGFGNEGFIGPIRLQLRQAFSQAMIDDFLKPPTDNLGKKGLLLAYYKNGVKHIAVDDNVGKKIVLDDSGAAVEIVEYLANARPDANQHFHSAGDVPRNPLLELKVHEPGQLPMRQLAFAKTPLSNLDEVSERICPVKFYYLHPADLGSALELLQTDAGQLVCRVIADHKLVPRGEVKVGASIAMPGKFVFSLVEYVPHARQKLVFEPQPATVKDTNLSGAAEIEITVAGATHTFWLQRNHPDFGSRILVTPQGKLQVNFGHAEVPLGFSLKLVKFRKGVNPGGAGNAAFASVVHLVDKDRGIDEERTISMNEPLTFNHLTLYQSGFNEAGHGIKTSSFSIGHDPGRWLKYLGCLLICLGSATMFYMRAYFFQRTTAYVRAGSVSDGPESVASGEGTLAHASGSERTVAHASGSERTVACASDSEKETSIQSSDPSPALEMVSSGPQ